MKTCNTCKTPLTGEHFSKRAASKDGLCAKCKTCQKEYHAGYYRENKEFLAVGHAKAKKKYRATEKGRETAKNQRKEYMSRPEVKQANKLTEEAYALRKRLLERTRYAANPSKGKAKTNARRARRTDQMPQWLTTEHKEQITEIYSTCPTGYHVDHIIPLNGETVSGLHVPWNLQHLSAAENCSKGNKLFTQSA